tara:strand:+ start:101 stop:574 length:474 start_codon:yes stop_codon:yes gene_type:complete
MLIQIKHKLYYLLFVVLVSLDQFTKQIFMSSYDLGDIVPVNLYLSWHYVQNTGAAFSFMANGGFIQKTFLLSVSLLVSIWLIFWIQRTSVTHLQKLFGQFLLLSGAVGNLIDRAQFGFVIDFIEVHVFGFNWPVFNLADSFIFLGVVFILFERKSTA